MERGRCTGSGWIMPGAKDYRPQRLAITPTIRHYVPASSPAGGRSLLGWVFSLRTGNSIRLLPLGGSCRRQATEGAWSGVATDIGLHAARGRKPPSPAPCKYPYHQALRASFLPRWGKKPFCWLFQPLDGLSYGNVLFSWLAAHANSGLGMQRNQLQHPPAGPHRDDRERRQIPVPFFGAA